MNLYLLTQTENEGYDTYDAAVVCAESAEVAAAIHPSVSEANVDPWKNDVCRTWASSPTNVIVGLIGEAASDVAPGVVLASFNAG